MTAQVIEYLLMVFKHRLCLGISEQQQQNGVLDVLPFLIYFRLGQITTKRLKDILIEGVVNMSLMMVLFSK